MGLMIELIDYWEADNIYDFVTQFHMKKEFLDLTGQHIDNYNHKQILDQHLITKLVEEHWKGLFYIADNDKIDKIIIRQFIPPKKEDLLLEEL